MSGYAALTRPTGTCDRAIKPFSRLMSGYATLTRPTGMGVRGPYGFCGTRVGAAAPALAKGITKGITDSGLHPPAVPPFHGIDLDALKKQAEMQMIARGQTRHARPFR